MIKDYKRLLLTVYFPLFTGPKTPVYQEGGSQTCGEYSYDSFKFSCDRFETSVDNQMDASTLACIALKHNRCTETPKTILQNSTTSTEDIYSGYISTLRDEQMKSLFGVSKKVFNVLLGFIESHLKEPRKFTKSEKLGVTLMKLKLNISNEAIGHSNRDHATSSKRGRSEHFTT